MPDDPRIAAVPDIHGHAKGEHKLFVDERPIPYTARMLFLWFFHACRRGAPRFLMVADHVNYLTFEDPAAVNLVRRALKLAQAGDLYGAAETAGVEVHHANVVGEGLRRGMRYSIGAEVDNDPRSRPDAQNIVDAMRPDGIVRSVHFLPIKHPQLGDWMWPFDNPEFREFYDVVGTEQTWGLYMATLLDAIEKLPGHIVGHFYVPAKFGHWPSDELLEGYEDRLLDACLERGMAVEINSRYYYKHAADDEAQLEKYGAANSRLLAKAKAKGVLVAVGSDAHSPKDQGRGFGDVLALLDRAEVNEIAFPIDGRLARVALRATDELRQARARVARDERAETTAIADSVETHASAPTIASANGVASTSSHQNVVAGSAPATSTPPVTEIPSGSDTPKKRPSRAKKPKLAPSDSEAGVSAEVAAPKSADAPEPKAPTEDAAPERFALRVGVQASGDVDESVLPVAAPAYASDVPTSPAQERAPRAAGKAATTEVGKQSAAGSPADTATLAGAPVAALPAALKPTGDRRDVEEPSVPSEPAAAAVEAAAKESVADDVTAAVEPAAAEPAATQPAARDIAGGDPVAESTDTPAVVETVASDDAPQTGDSEVTSPRELASDAADIPETTHAKPRERAKPKRIASTADAPKRSKKPAAKAARPSKAAAASRKSPTAKKTAAKKAPAKKATRAVRVAASAAKKPTAKKAPPARKSTAKPVSKTASRTSAKKTPAKKTAAKKKVTKRR